MPRGPEAKIQDTVVKYARKKQVMAIKLESSNTNGLPDYLFSHIDCGPFLMEFKAPGRAPRPLQVVRQQEMADHGFTVFPCVDSVRMGMEIIDAMIARRVPETKPVAGL